MADNSLFRRRQAARGRPLGDYQDPLYYRAIKTTGGAEGPLSYPAVPGDVIGNTVEDKLDELIRLLTDLPQRLSLEARTRFSIEPREITPFIATNNVVALPANGSVAVATFVLGERYTGFLTAVGTTVLPPGAAGNVGWDVRISGFIHPNYDKLIFTQNTLSTPIPFEVELTQSTTVSLVANELAGVATSVGGILVGWTEFMSTYKPYGAESASGLG